MTKSEMANILADAMNILNDVQSEDISEIIKGQIHNLFAKMPTKILAEADFANNGTLMAKDLAK